MNYLERIDNAIKSVLIGAVKSVFSFSTTTEPVDQETGKYYRTTPQYAGTYNQQKALQSTAIFGGVKILGEDVGSLPLVTYERKGNDGQEPVPDYPLYEILHDMANPETTAMELREAVTAHAVLCGTGYAKIIRRNDGSVLALWLLMPYDVTPARTSRGAQYFKVRENGVEKSYASEDIFVLRGFGVDCVSGLNILEVARQTIGLTLDQAAYASSFFQNDHTPGIILHHPGPLGVDGVLGVKKAWRDSVASHDVAVTQEDMKATVVGQTNTDAQLVEQRTFQIAEVCRMLRMQPHKLAELSHATFSNIEELNIQYYTETLRPWLVRWEQAITRCLIPAQDRRRIFSRHSIEGLLRGDFKTQTDGFAKLLEKGVFSINNVRRLLNFNPIEGGDEHFIQLNMQPVEGAAERAAELMEAAKKPDSSEPPKLRRVKGL